MRACVDESLSLYVCSGGPGALVSAHAPDPSIQTTTQAEAAAPQRLAEHQDALQAKLRRAEATRAKGK